MRRKSDAEIKKYVNAEFGRFLAAIGWSDENRKDREQMSALLYAMRETGKKRGMSEYELSTLYDAGLLLDLYRLTLETAN